jgi:glycosyltransferase involved in cell wall biosynthesis
MRCWLITVGEPLPTDPGRPRLLRAGILASMLASQGHDTVWWSSAFNHSAKVHRPPPSADALQALGYSLRLLDGGGYRRNVGLARVRDHRQLALQFEAQAHSMPRPDVILASYPTIELCEAAVRFGRAQGVPVVLDVRDLWPDIFVNLAPPPLQGVARWALGPMFRASARAFQGATAITGVTEGFVGWGCERAGRARGGLDVAYPLAYEAGGVDAADVERARQRWVADGIEPAGRTVCFFGTLGRQFDIATVLDAARLLRDDDVRIVLCGAGDRLETYREQARDLPNVLLPGWVDAPAIRALMALSMAGLAPYLNEHSFTLNIPNKPIEYMAGGLPVLSCLTGELQRLLVRDDCGLQWQEGDPASLAAVIRAIVRGDGLHRRLSDNAKRAYRRHFVADAVYGDMIKHLSSIARREPPRRPAGGAGPEVPA